MDEKRIIALLQKYRANALSVTEAAEWEAIMTSADDRAVLQQLMQRDLEAASPAGNYDPLQWQAVFHRIVAVDRVTMRRMRFMRRWSWMAAAAVLFALITTAYFLIHPVEKQALATITPGTDRAMLTLADGTIVTLDSTGNQLIMQGNAAVQQTGGQLVYEKNNISAHSFNTLTTPRGGQFRVKLPDGTNVWLNAASSLRYPMSFSGNERKVEVTGEAYFEVAKDSRMPFIVKLDQQTEVLVLGTDFNINAYTDEGARRVTLVNGAVKVVSGRQAAVLKPGEQGLIGTGKQLKVEDNINIEQVVAWRKGMFSFAAADIHTIMRQISRWYNVDVIFETTTNELFTFEIPREAPLKDLLESISLVGKLKFVIRNNQIIVSK